VSLEVVTCVAFDRVRSFMPMKTVVIYDEPLCPLGGEAKGR
jgi:hypothetical protein